MNETSYCNYSGHRGPREIPVERFGRYKSGNPKSICRLCDSMRQQIYKARMLADPETAERFRHSQAKYAKKWRERPGNKERQRKYRRDWYDRNKDSITVRNSRDNWLKRHPDRARAASKRWRDKIMADPVLHQEFLENRRIEYTLRQERAGRTIDRRKTIEKKKQTYALVDAEPFREWVRPKIKNGTLSPLTLSYLTGWDESHCRRLVSGTSKRVSLHNIDKVLVVLDGPPLRSLYPDS